METIVHWSICGAQTKSYKCFDHIRVMVKTNTEERNMQDYSGKTIKLKNGTIKLIKKAGQAGGQGTVYFADFNGKNYGFKILFSKDDPLGEQKCKNIKELLRRKAKLDQKIGDNGNFTFTFPIEETKVDGEEAYLMEWATGKDVSTLIEDGTFDKYSLQERLEVIWKINEALLFLSQDALCYQDINAENIFYDTVSKLVTVIDTENTTDAYMVENGEAAFVKGKGFYMAPEVGAGLVKCAAKPSDYYAMAALYYSILTCSTNSPYHGRVLYENFSLRDAGDMDIACERAEEDDELEDFLTFTFDPTNHVNSLEDFCKEVKGKWKEESNKRLLRHLEGITKNWNEVPNELKELLYKAFSNPLNPACYTKRPLPLAWERRLKKLLNKDACSTVPDNSGKEELSYSNKPNLQNGCGLYLFNSFGDRLYLTDDETLIPMSFVDSNSKGGFGKVKKHGNEWVFVKMGIWNLEASKNNRYCCSNVKEIVIEEGMRIFQAGNSKIFIGIERV